VLSSQISVFQQALFSRDSKNKYREMGQESNFFSHFPSISYLNGCTKPTGFFVEEQY